ncbi:LPXTG cell wall anchor domain-containing protein, partial [Aerococcaceae bacterium NML191219]|nr:LPXTG cell wall anchor domain-containing protein [Aerococcaceae bacterium NML191219]
KAEGCQVGPVQVELVNAQDEVVETATATEPDGEVTFTAVPLNAAGEVTYTVRQKDVADTAHVQYDKEPKTVTITVTKNDATNALEAAEPATVVFNNQCKPVVPTEAVIKAKVKSEGCVVGKIKVELVDANGKVLQTKEVDPVGGVEFEVINYDKPGENVYTIRQVANDTPFVKYDKAAKKVTVSITEDKKANKLAAKVSDEPEFTNECINPTPAKVVIEAKVKNEGCEVEPEPTQFELVRDGKVIQTVTSKNGKVMFTPESFDKVEKVTYQIRQLPGKTPKVIYDEKVVTVTVDVTNNDKNELSGAASYTNDGTFVNKCEPNDPKPKLPKTGEFNTILTTVLGAGLLIGGAVLAMRKYKESR